MSVENTKRRLKRATDSMDAIREKIKVLKKELIDNENADIIRGVRRAMTFDEFIEWIKLFNEDAKKAGIEKSDTDASEKESKNVQTMGCTDCSRTPLACSVPTLEQGLDDYH